MSACHVAMHQALYYQENIGYKTVSLLYKSLVPSGIFNFHAVISECIKKQRHHLPKKICVVFGFLVVMYRCESWTVKKIEH